MPIPPSKRPRKKYSRSLSKGKNNKAPSHVDPVPEQPAVDDAYLSMDVSQLRRKVKDLIGLKNKNRKTIDNLKKEVAKLQKAKSTLEKTHKTDVGNRDRKLRDLSESHKNQISAIHDIHTEDIAKKDAKINDYAMKLIEQRKTSNIVSYNFITINYGFNLFFFCYLLFNLLLKFIFNYLGNQ